jgi:hypothetical protein
MYVRRATQSNIENQTTIGNMIASLRYRVRIMVFNATFNSISVISWQTDLLVEETEVPTENH